MKQRSKRNNFSQSREPRGRKLMVSSANTLLPFLLEVLGNQQSKTSIKDLLRNGHLAINGNGTKQFDAPLHVGDAVTISYERRKVPFSHPQLQIVYEDDSLIVVNKRHGLLTIATAAVKEKTAYHLLSDYVKKNDPRCKIFILHRLDRDTSGLLMFAKNRGVQETMQSNWNEMITDRVYVAVVEGQPTKETDLLTSYLRENTNMKVYVSDAADGQEAVTRYRTIRSNGRYTLLELSLETGRKNQIRAQMESIGNPIAGDEKYGAMTNPISRLALHAKRLRFIHPITGEEMNFETPVPSSFNAIVK